MHEVIPDVEMKKRLTKLWKKLDDIDSELFHLQHNANGPYENDLDTAQFNLHDALNTIDKVIKLYLTK